MATPTTKTTTATEMPDLAQQLSEQLLAAVRQGHQLSIDAAQTWVKAVSVLPVHNLGKLPKVPGMPAVPGVEAVTKYSFDFASDLLSAQRDFTLQLAGVFVPAPSV